MRDQLESRGSRALLAGTSKPQTVVLARPNAFYYFSELIFGTVKPVERSINVDRLYDHLIVIARFNTPSLHSP